MATIVASRYAVLSVDDDDEDLSSKEKKVPPKKPGVVKPQNTTSVKHNGCSKKKKKQENTQTQSTKNQKPNSGASSKKQPMKQSPMVKQPTSEQWEEWKQKDNELVDENFEEDFSKAILLSKLDYEKKKDFYESIRNAEDERKGNKKKNRKSQKVMSLSEFNNLGSQSTKKDLPAKQKTEDLENDPEFFNRLDEDIQNEISKERLLEIKRRNDFNSQGSLALVIYKACIEEKDREIEQLKEEIKYLNVQLKNVKTRNMKLCQIIANGEMKDKAEILMEVEQLQTVKDELSSEVATLHVQLEQERSKVRQLTAERKSKDKNKKLFS